MPNLCHLFRNYFSNLNLPDKTTAKTVVFTKRLRVYLKAAESVLI